jgi:hypothetical protein
VAEGFLAALLRLVPWATEKGARFLGRPILRVSFDQARSYDTIRVGDLAGNPRGFFCHCLVSNDGRTTAQECRARLMSVSRVEGDAEFRVPEFRAPRTLKWSNEADFGPRDILAGLSGRRRADLCYGIDGSTFLWFMVPPEEIGVGVQTRFPAGHYRVRVHVEGSNVPVPGTVTLDIRFSGVWNEIRVEQQR